MRQLAGMTALIVTVAVVGVWRPQTAVALRGTLVVDSVASPTGPGSAEPNLSLGADGKAYLTWLEPADSAFSLRFAVFDGARWSAPRTIRTARDFFVNWADFPSMEALTGGRLAAHWLQRTAHSSYAYGVRISESRDGGVTWSEPVVPHRDSSANEHGFVSLWREGASLGAVWLDGRKFGAAGHSATNEMMLVTTTLGPGGALARETRLDERTCDCCQTTVAMTAAGPIIAYRNRSADEIRDIYVVRRVGGKWSTPAPASNDNWRIAACPVNGPAIAATGNRVALAWFTAANDTPRVKVAFSSNGGESFGLPMKVDDGSPAGRVDVVQLPDGSALVSWIERTGGEAAVVRARRISTRGVAGAAYTIATSSAARASGFPRMAVVKDNVLFAWTAPGKPSIVRIARLTAAELR
jgi:hypothetical protein